MLIYIKIYYFSSYLIFFILFFIQKSFSLIEIHDYIMESTQLDNGNILLISSNRFYIVDPSFKRIINQTVYIILVLMIVIK